MKRFKMLLVCLICVGFSVPGYAYFEDVSLIQVVYEKGGDLEVVTDLGSFFSLGSGTGDNSAVPVAPGLFPETPMENLYVSYFAKDSANLVTWLSGIKDEPVSGAASEWLGLHYAMSMMQNSLSCADSRQQVSASQNAVASYWNLLNRSGQTTGQFGGFLGIGQGEVSLAALAGGGYVEQTLFSFAPETPYQTILAGVPVATLRTYWDSDQGAIRMSLVPVALPSSLLLFSSGVVFLSSRKRLFP